MSESAGSRPPSSFYADINDSYFPADYFDQSLAAVREHAEWYRQNASDVLAKPVEPNLADEDYWRYIRTDFMVMLPEIGGHIWRVIDRGGGFRLALSNQGALEPRQDRVIGSGCDADDTVLETMDMLPSSHFIPPINSDGVQLEAVDHLKLYTEEDPDDHIYEGTGLFEAGLAAVYQHELLFDGDKLRIPHPRSHYQFGVQTKIGFVPLVTLLDDKHPVMERIFRETPADSPVDESES